MNNEPKTDEIEDDTPFDASTIEVRKGPSFHDDPEYSQEAIDKRRNAAKQEALKRKD